MDSLITNVLGVLITSVIIPLLLCLGQKLSSWLSSKARGEKAARILARASDIISDVLKMLSQTEVGELKASGRFDKNAQDKMFDKAKSLILSNLSEEAKAFITNEYGNLAQWVEIKIESELYQLKA